LTSLKSIDSEVPSFYSGSLPTFACETFLHKSLWKNLEYGSCRQYWSWARSHMVGITMALFMFARFWCTPTHVHVQSKTSSYFPLRQSLQTFYQRAT